MIDYEEAPLLDQKLVEGIRRNKKEAIQRVKDLPDYTNANFPRTESGEKLEWCEVHKPGLSEADLAALQSEFLARLLSFKNRELEFFDEQNGTEYWEYGPDSYYTKTPRMRMANLNGHCYPEQRLVYGFIDPQVPTIGVQTLYSYDFCINRRSVRILVWENDHSYIIDKVAELNGIPHKLAVGVDPGGNLVDMSERIKNEFEQSEDVFTEALESVLDTETKDTFFNED